MTRALVLGGGGPVGIAWESGLAAGLASEGVDVSQADFIIGTSAGSAVGAQLAMGRAPGDMHAAVAAQAANSSHTRPAPPSATTDAMTPLMDLMQKAVSGEIAREALYKEIGAFALSAQTMSEDDFIATFGRMLATADSWPSRKYACTAVDVLAGEFVLWDNDASVPLSRAVASSCSVPGVFPPITINGSRYMDGGMRSGTNADCARGYDRVLVVAVIGGREGPLAEYASRALKTEIDDLRQSGSAVELISPDQQSLEAFGINLMDASRRGSAAAAGFEQGKQAAKKLEAFWNSEA